MVSIGANRLIVRIHRIDRIYFGEVLVQPLFFDKSNICYSICNIRYNTYLKNLPNLPGYSMCFHHLKLLTNMLHRFTTVTLLAVLLPMLVWAQSRPFVIEAKLGSIRDSDKAFLSYTNPADGSRHMDSVSITNGQFTFRGTLSLPGRAFLYTAQRFNETTGFTPSLPPRIMLYLEPGAIKVVSVDSLNNATIQGGAINADYNQLRAALKSSEVKMDKLMAEFMALPAQKRDDKTTEAEYDKKNDVIMAEQAVIYKQFIKQKPNSLVSLGAVKSAGGYKPDPAVVRPLFNSLSASVRNSPLGKLYDQELANLEQIKIGAPAPDFTQPDPSGKAVSLHDFKGQYVLLDFWGSGCVPCRKENPDLVKLFNQYKTRNFTILGIGIDEKKSAWMNAIQKDGLPWTQVSDLKFWNNDVVKRYAIRLIPQNLLIGPDGVILARNLYGDELANKLAQLLPPSP